MNHSRRLFPLLLVLLTVAVVARAAEPNDGDSAASKFLRFVPDKHGGGTLQASTVRYENADGVTVDLVAAVHIAEPSFFQSLESSWDDYDAVLYELVAPKEMLGPSTQGSGLRSLRSTTTRPTTTPRRSFQLNMVGALQRFMRDELKLAFQLEAIDYKRPNFIHADLDAETFQKMQSDRGESMLTLMLDSMFREMARGPGGAAGPSLPELLMAMKSPDKARQLKLLIGRQFGQIDEQMAGMEGEKGSVILSERNKAAMRVLKETLAKGDKRNIAIFYGAGHLKGMDKILTQEMGFRQVGPPFWRVAWDMTMTGEPTTKPAATRSTTVHAP